jgi:hypothetical protein
MKRILIAIILSLVVLSGCVVIEKKDEGVFTTKTSVIESGNVEEKDVEYDVVLSGEGFERDEITVGIGQDLSIICTSNVTGHYLTLNGQRISNKELNDGEIIDVALDKIGNYKIIDEETKSALFVKVI